MKRSRCILPTKEEHLNALKVPRHQCSKCDHQHWPNKQQNIIDRHFNICLDCHQWFPGGDVSYSVLPNVWAEAGLQFRDGVLHIQCLAKRLKRKLQLSDFTDHPVNDQIRWAVQNLKEEN